MQFQIEEIISGEIKIARYIDQDSPSDANDLLDCVFRELGYDLLITDFPLSSSLEYPEKIVHQLTTDSISTWLEQISSKDRSEIKRAEKRCMDAELRFECTDAITEAEFAVWYEMYLKIIPKLKYGRMKVHGDWLKEKQEDVPALLVYNSSGEMIAGTLLKEFEDKYSRSYAWADENAKKLMFPTYEIKLLVEYALSKQKNTLSFGMDTNLYGGHLSTGLLYFKQRWGTNPIIPENLDGKTRQIVVSSSSEKDFSFFYLEDNNLKQYRHISK